MPKEVKATATIHTKYGNEVFTTKEFNLNGLPEQLSNDSEFLIVGGIVIPKSNVHHIILNKI